MGKAALFMAERSYPISMTYIHCMMAVCAINRKHKQEAQEEMLRSWELALLVLSSSAAEKDLRSNRLIAGSIQFKNYL